MLTKVRGKYIIRFLDKYLIQNPIGGGDFSTELVL
jgi:hypothetical protein